MDALTRMSTRGSSHNMVRSWSKELENRVKTVCWLYLICPSPSNEHELRKIGWVFQRLSHCYASRMLSQCLSPHQTCGSTPVHSLPQLVHVPDEPEASPVAQKMSKRELALHFLRLQKEGATLLQRRAGLEGALDRAKAALSDAEQERNIACQGYSSAKHLTLFESNFYQERVTDNNASVGGPEHSGMVVLSQYPQLLRQDALLNLDVVGFAPNSSFNEANGVHIEEVEEDEVEQAKLAQILWIDEHQLATMNAEQRVTNQNLEQEIEDLTAELARCKRQSRTCLAQADYLRGEMQRLVQLGSRYRQQTEELFQQQMQQASCVAPLLSPPLEKQQKKGLITRFVEWVRK